VTSPLDVDSLETLSEDKLYSTGHQLTERSRALLEKAKGYFVGHKASVGVLFVGGTMKYPMFLKSGNDGGPWGGTQRGNVPRGPGRAFTQGAPHEGNIATHVEGHASAIMWQRKINLAYLLVDRAMCSVCHRDLHVTLPPGGTMLVYSDAEGKTIVRASHGS
jgi:hypothetical protein